MQAVRLAAPRQIEIVEVPEPRMGVDDVLVEMRFVGLCGSDLNTYRGLSPMVTYPRVPGHETAGVIIGRGDHVPDGIRIGDCVTLNPYTECGLCPACRAGRPNCCQFNQTLGVQRDGALTRRIVVPYVKVHVSRVLSLKELALVEPLSVGYHAANRGRVSENDSVLVIGAGTIGMGAIVAASRKGAMVIAADVDDGKLVRALGFGAQHAIRSDCEDVLDRVRELTDGEGVSVAIEAVGLPQTYRMAIDAAAYAGRVVYIGYAKGDVSYDTKEFVRKELDILGSRNALRVFPSVIRMMERRERPFTDLITRVYPFAMAEQAFRDWDAAPAQVSKILIDVAV
jgi:L-galactonate 5-dehydrogenase